MSLDSDLERDHLISSSQNEEVPITLHDHPVSQQPAKQPRRFSFASVRPHQQSIIGLLTVSLVCVLSLTAVILLSADPSVPTPSSNPVVQSASRPHFDRIPNLHTHSIQSEPEPSYSDAPAGPPAIKQLLSSHYEDCKAMHPTAESWAEPPYHKRVFIAANLHNNRAIVVDFLVELQRTIAAICQPSINQPTELCPNVYVSLYASSSSDTQTQGAMDLFAAYLESMNISHTIESRGMLNRENRERIDHLADVRNAVMMPFAAADSQHGRERFANILFVNDVLFCSEDAVRLLTLTDQANASMTCGLDFDDIQVQGEPKYYDIWVGRSITGRQTKKIYPFYDGAYSQRAVKAGRPFRVFCCWNGMVAINAAEFRQPDALSFRARDREFYLTDKSVKRDTCESSECSHLCEDMWSKHGSETKILLDPTVHVAYIPRVFSAIRKQPWYNPIDQPRPHFDDHVIISGEFVNSTSLLTRTDEGISWWCCNLDWKCREHEVKFWPGVV